MRQTPTAEMPVLVPHRPPPPATDPSAPPRPRRPTHDLCDAPKIVVGDVPFTITTFEGAVQWLLTPTTLPAARSVRLANAYCVAHARQDAEYAELLLNSLGVNLPDGTPVYWLMSRTARGHALLPERVRGPSLFTCALSAENTHVARHFFLGGTPGTLDRLHRQINRRYPAVQIAGMHAPPFGPITPDLIEDWAGRVIASGATIVWLGLGSPKQDYASTLLAPRVGLHCVGVGAAFDFLAGSRREAPQWMQGHALEWAYRLLTEPRRLWRRYLLGNIAFLRAATIRPGRSRRIIPGVRR